MANNKNDWEDIPLDDWKDVTEQKDDKWWMTSFDKAAINFPKSLVGVVKNMATGIVNSPSMAKTLLNTNDPLAPEKAVYSMSAAIINGMKDKYGTVEKVKKVFEDDPASMLADISIIAPSLDPMKLVYGPLKTTAKAVTETLPKWGYRSSIKMSPSALSIEERNRRAITGLDNAIMPTEGGYEKLNKLISGIESKVQGPIDDAAARGVTIPGVKPVQYADELAAQRKLQPNPVSDLNTIKSSAEEFLDVHNPMFRGIPIDEAQKIKKGAYLNLKEKYEKRGSAGVEAEKALARGLKDEVYDVLVQSHPELRSLGEKEGALIALKDSIISGVKRIQNLEGIPLRGAIAGSAGNIPMIAASVMELPRVKAALAIALFKAGQSSKKYLGETARLAGKLPPYAYAIGAYGNGGNNE